MSYCQIISFKNGNPINEAEFRNSHGGGPYIWNALFEKYLKDPFIPYDSWITRNPDDRSLWDLAKRKDLPLFERAVHAATFDYATVSRDHFKIYAEHLKRFVEEYYHENYICHLMEWAKFIEKSDGDLICFYGTSIIDNPWHVYDEEKDEYSIYDFDKMDKHFEVYNWINEIYNQSK